jgi:hypothetical protein
MAHPPPTSTDIQLAQATELSEHVESKGDTVPLSTVPTTVSQDAELQQATPALGPRYAPLTPRTPGPLTLNFLFGHSRAAIYRYFHLLHAQRAICQPPRGEAFIILTQLFPKLRLMTVAK